MVGKILTGVGVLIGCIIIAVALPPFCSYVDRSVHPPKEFGTTRLVVERIFMHEPEDYSFFIREPGTTELKTLKVRVLSPERLKIFEDVRTGEPCWINLGDTWNNHSLSLDIHIDSPTRVEGAGWNHGKFGRGQTVPIR
jgi:hypothetical protein